MAKQSITRDTWIRFGLPAPAVEVRFHAKRKFRVDFVWQAFSDNAAANAPAYRLLAVEVHGGIWTRGAHSGGRIQARDLVKGQLLTLAGYARMEFTPAQVASGYAAPVVKAWLERDAAPELPPDPEDRRRKGWEVVWKRKAARATKGRKA